MKLSKFFHKPQYIEKVSELDFKEGKNYFGDLALQWLNEYKDYYTLIKNNLKFFNLPDNKQAVKKAVRNIGYHYYEKFLAFQKEPEFYPDFFERIIKPDDLLVELENNQEEYQPAVILCTHFGGMPLIVGVLNYCHLDLSIVIKFPSEEFRKMQEDKIKHIQRTLDYGRIRFFEADKQPMNKIGSRLKAGETFFTVLDEHTPMSKNVTFLGKTISGGAGVDQIINFVGRDKIKLYFSIMERLEDNYKLNLHKIDLNSSNYIQDMFNIYEKYVAAGFEQWFFLQEVQENLVQ